MIFDWPKAFPQYQKSQTSCTSEYPHPTINSAEKYRMAGRKKVCRGQGTGGTTFEAEKTQVGRGKQRKGKEKAGGQGTGGTTFEAGKPQAGEERKGKEGGGRGGGEGDGEERRRGVGK